MNSNQIENGLLINEWQLGAQLNVAVANGTRDKFNLLLSLLSSDAQDFAQFDLPKATQNSLSQMELRESFSLPLPLPLVNAGHSLHQAKVISVAINKKELLGARLQSLLNNEAILSRTSNVSFEPEVVDNLSFLSQSRLKHVKKENENSQPDRNYVDYEMLKKIEDLNLSEKPLKVSYM